MLSTDICVFGLRVFLLSIIQNVPYNNIALMATNAQTKVDSLPCISSALCICCANISVSNNKFAHKMAKYKFTRRATAKRWRMKKNKIYTQSTCGQALGGRLYRCHSNISVYLLKTWKNWFVKSQWDIESWKNCCSNFFFYVCKRYIWSTAKVIWRHANPRKIHIYCIYYTHKH